jgi:hypothetical protein
MSMAAWCSSVNQSTIKTSIMKIPAIALAATVVCLASCKQEAAYVDLNSGETITLDTNDQTGQVVNAKTGEPVLLYVVTASKDTVYAPTGQVVNNKVVKTETGSYIYADASPVEMEVHTDDNGASAVKEGDYKMKVEEDGDVKIKDGDKKIKIDGETGEKKVKND